MAVILSGDGNDGATGAVAVHQFGGTVLAADEASSPHLAMPAAVISRDEVVDEVLPVVETAKVLIGLANPEHDKAPVG